MPDFHEPTIAAIATPPGPGGIGIIRISGPDARPILTKLFKPRTKLKKFVSHKLYFGWIVAQENNHLIDEVLAVYMQAPSTYTREDVAEIHCHGSFVILQEILSQIFSAGARPAAQGEFTKRAFLNGRIDLTQAEAVIELLNARTTEGLEIAVNQLRGTLHSEIEAIRDILVSIKAVLEVAIDFPEEEGDIINADKQKIEIAEKVIPVLEKLIQSSDKGQIFREGISIVIIGKPNVGKSSLLNALLKRDRAIVTEIPGTTRDTIEEYLNIRGMPVKIVDTAGIRKAEGAVEKIGIQRSKEKLEEADLVLLVIDSSSPLQQEDHDLYQHIGDKKIIIVANKKDLAKNQNIYENFKKLPIIPISAKTTEGIEELEDAVFKQVAGGLTGWDPGCSCAPNTRHKSSLEKSLRACNRIITGFDERVPADLLAIEIQSSLDALGDIVGYTTSEDVLDKIFAEFCIGK
jgi:tRNA modification GTPase